jgi:hypothetical protein
MKIGNLYNLDSFQAFMDSGAKRSFADSYAGTVLARNLTAVDPRIFEKKYPELVLLGSGIEADNTGGYARRIQSLRLVDQGSFTDAGDDTTKGKISLTAEDSYLKVFVKEAHSIWTEDEVKEAELQNINLPQKYLAAHNKIYNQTVDSIGLLGHNTQKGLLNFASFTSTAATAAIAVATAQELYDDISGLVRAQWDGVYNTAEYMADRVVMPTDVYNKLSATILNTAAGASTVLKALQDNLPGIKFLATAKADNVDGGGSVTCAFSTNREAMTMRIPVPLTIGELMKTNSFDFRVDSKFRIAGLDILEATAGYYLTGL